MDQLKSDDVYWNENSEVTNFLVYKTYNSLQLITLITVRNLSGYCIVYKVEIYPPRLCPNNMNFSSPIAFLHASSAATIWVSITLLFLL